MHCLLKAFFRNVPVTPTPSIQKRKISPKDRSFRPDVPADIRPKTSVRPFKSWKNKHFGTGMPRELRSEKLRADFSFPKYFSKSTAVQMGGVLPYKWEAYCSTNGRRIAGFPSLGSLEFRKVRRYKWGAYCRTNWRCTAVLFRQVVGVGVSETLPISPGNDLQLMSAMMLG